MSEKNFEQVPGEMHRLFARLTAMGFIILMLGANVWLVLGLVGAPLPPWLKVSAGVGVCLVGAGGFGFLSLFCMQFLKMNK